jgi:hypothetical protein
MQKLFLNGRARESPLMERLLHYITLPPAVKPINILSLQGGSAAVTGPFPGRGGGRVRELGRREGSH